LAITAVSGSDRRIQTRGVQGRHRRRGASRPSGCVSDSRLFALKNSFLKVLHHFNDEVEMGDTPNLLAE